MGAAYGPKAHRKKKKKSQAGGAAAKETQRRKAKNKVGARAARGAWGALIIAFRCSAAAGLGLQTS